MKNKKPNEPTNTEEMTEDLMNELLMDLSSSVYWPAICRYNNERYKVIDNGLRTLDPFKDPTNMARTQGFFGGLSDIIKYVEELQTKAREREEPIPE